MAVSNRFTDKDAKRGQSTWLATATHTILPTVITVILLLATVYFLAIPALEQSLMTAKRRQIRELAQVAIELLDQYHRREQSGELTTDEAKYRAAERIRAMRYGPESKDYYWINDIQGNMIMHPYRTDLEGKNIIDLVDEQGKPFVAVFIDTVQKDGAGYVNYMWQWKDESERIVPKLSYVMGFAPWDWIVGTGIYLKDVQEEIAQITNKVNRAFTLVLIIAAFASTYIIWQGRKAEILRSRAEVELLESENRFRQLSNAAYEGIVIHDKGVVLEANPQYFQMFGYQPKELIGLQALPLTTTPESEQFIRKHISVEEGGPYHAVGRRKDESTFPIEARVRSLEYHGKKVRVAAIRDVTEVKEAEEERIHLLQKLASKNKELYDVLYAASHDLRSPLVNVQGFAGELERDCSSLGELLKQDSLSPQQQDKLRQIVQEEIPQSLHFIRAGIKKISGLLDGLLQVSRVGSEKLHFEILDMNALVHEALAAMQYQIQERKATVTCHDLPPCVADADRVNQVFSNLIDNALKYLDPDRLGHIDITGHIENNMAVYHIVDNGIGIEPEQHEAIFKIFHRLHPSNGNGEGLGLTIVYRILERLDGTIRVESEPGKGSTFIVTLPAPETPA
ncbi:MAG: cache domain-containing protein [Sedimentisphaerales bacterium]|nr:cache domain-containing protein [Sedimentisphaerales bacterium]